jgi:hypothetical protein
VLVATVTGSAACTADPVGTNRWADGTASSAPGTTGPATTGPATAGPGAAPAWTEPRAYGFVLESTCGEPALIGRFRVAVADGRVTRVDGLDESARRATRTSESELVPTLGQLVQAAVTAREDGAEVVRTEVDPTDGHPTRVTIDPAVDGVDDGSCYAVSEYTVGVQPAPTT